MGYTYEFRGQFRVRPPLSNAHRLYLRAFAATRRMKRTVGRLRGVPDPLRDAVNLPLGPEGGYFIGHDQAEHGEAHPQSVADSGTPPVGQPGLWCDWVPTDDGQNILVQDDGETFYNFPQWLEYIIANFLAPWGYSLDGQVQWRGEDWSDEGTLLVRKNRVDSLGTIIANKGTRQARRLQVFLCHAAEDRSRVRKLASRLRDDNIDVWLDQKHLLPGHDWELEIKKALRSSDAVVLCLSPIAVAKRGFVQREIRLALIEADEQYPFGEPRLLAST